PLASMVNWLADSNAYIVAPEQDTDGFGFTERRQIGSGPFTWLEWDEHNFASVTRNEQWHGGRARCAGVTVQQPADTQQVEGNLRVHDLDVACVGRDQATYLKGAVPELEESHVGNALFFGMRFFTAPFGRPYDDPRVRSALTYAI